MASSTISVHNLGKTYGEGDIAVHAVRNVELDVEPGEVVLIMGPSGSGKTTLLLMLGAMLRPTTGSIFIDGIDLASTPERQLPALRAHHLGFIFQDFNLLSSLTALENVELACNLAGSTGRAASDRSIELLNHVGLSERLHFRPDQLSGGEKQRVAIARALVNRPSLVLADEPTANLDSGHGREIARLLRQLAHEQRCSIVIVSHDERLREIADRTLWLEDGAFRALSALVTDPVCQMSVLPAAATPHFQRDGTTFWFCSRPCRDDFAADPRAYVQRQSKRIMEASTLPP